MQLTVRSSPRKIEKKPAYVLNILVPPDEVDNSFNPVKSIVLLKVCRVAAHCLSQSDLRSFCCRTNHP